MNIPQYKLDILFEVHARSNFPKKPLKLQSVFKYSTFSAALELIEIQKNKIIKNNILNKFFT